jgi:hypothetical protein
MRQILSESEEMIQIHLEGERGIRSNRRLGWDSGRNKRVRKEYRSHRRLGEAFGESAGDRRIRGQQES